MKTTVRLLRLAGLAFGGFAIAFGLLADFTGFGGSPGVGRRQWLIVLAGVSLIVASRTDRAAFARVRDRVQRWVRDEDSLDAGRIALFSITLGLLTGLTETLVLGIDRFVLGSIVRVGPHLVWMAPLLDAAILMTIGLLLWLVSRFWRKLATPEVVAFVLLALAVNAILYRIRFQTRLADEAKWILVIAVATALARVVAPRLASGRIPLRALATRTGLMVALLGLAAGLYPTLKERRAHAALSGAAEGQVSVILIILDTVRAASLSLYGYERPTSPHLARLARSGVLFERAVAPSSWTLPSHSSFFTGRHPGELGVEWRKPLDRRYGTLAEVLSENGFATAGFSANVGYVSKESGLGRGFARFEDFVATPGELVRTSVMLWRILRPLGLGELVVNNDRGRRSAEDINKAFLRWLDQQGGDRPFFAFINYFDAHAPFYAPAPFDTLFGGPVSPDDLVPWTPRIRMQAVSLWRDEYDRSLTYLDAQLGRLFDELDARGVFENAVVVVTSDHGEMLGEHKYMGHATTLYRPVIEVPFVLRGAGVPSGLRVTERVGLRDLAATLLDLARARNRGAIPGRSLAAAWNGAFQQQPAFSELGRGLRIAPHYPNAANDLWSVFDADAHYIVSTDSTEEFYRVSTDPREEENLAGRSPEPAELPAMRGLIKRHREQIAVALCEAPDSKRPRDCSRGALRP